MRPFVVLIPVKPPARGKSRFLSTSKVSIYSISLTAAGADGEVSADGIAVSAGSACSSGKMKESVVLAAMGVAPEIAGGFLRISFGPHTTEADVAAFLAEWVRIASRQKAA